ncbi:hypothetical protein H6P81_020831 [Aristolochia fimbriata]|uniref:J domain-containing protein n=1 Tax=Aristolochia fimbriata TaxID=158543 RepID=A0AAV7DYP3_ARIFI|nr:hypothetical protein H6P81_020831 [Aristolochia fimbriata]
MATKKEESSETSRRQQTAQRDEEGSKLRGLLLFGLIGAAATTWAAGKLRQTVDRFYAQLSRSFSWGENYSSFKEQSWKRYYRRMQEEHEDEMERLERIRRMQNVFNRAKNKRKSYETWTEYGPGAYHQYSQREDWYWKADTYQRNHNTKSGSGPTPRSTGNYVLSQHYSVLGLDRFRRKPYTDVEIKTAFRTKAMEFHPDQNQGNEETAEAKFKEVVASYEAIKQERKIGK